MELTAVLTHGEEGGFIALNPETGATTQGDTVEEAVANLKESTALNLSEFPRPPPATRSARCSRFLSLCLPKLHQAEVVPEDFMSALRK